MTIHIGEHLVFRVLNVKYLAFSTPDVIALYNNYYDNLDFSFIFFGQLNVLAFYQCSDKLTLDI